MDPKRGGLENPTSIEERNECQQWALKGVDWRIPRRLEKGTSTSKDTRPRTSPTREGSNNNNLC